MVCLVEDRILAESMSIQEACKIGARKMYVSRYIAQQWVQAARRERRVTDPLPEDLVAEVAKLRREIREVRETNELLKATSPFRASTRPKTLRNDCSSMSIGIVSQSNLFRRR